MFFFCSLSVLSLLPDETEKQRGKKILSALSCNSRYLLRSRPVSHVTAPRIRKSFGPSPPSSTRSEEKLVEDDNVSDGLYRGNNPQSTITAGRERERRP